MVTVLEGFHCIHDDARCQTLQKVCETAAVKLDMMTMKVERAARQLIDLLLSSLDTEIVLESTAVSGRATPMTTTISIGVPKKADIAEIDLKPGIAIPNLGYVSVLSSLFR
jgi:hypothetical protein